jgi:hypothetical protein
MGGPRGPGGHQSGINLLRDLQNRQGCEVGRAARRHPGVVLIEPCSTAIQRFRTVGARDVTAVACGVAVTRKRHQRWEVWGDCFRRRSERLDLRELTC